MPDSRKIAFGKAAARHGREMRGQV